MSKTDFNSKIKKTIKELNEQLPSYMMKGVNGTLDTDVLLRFKLEDQQIKMVFIRKTYPKGRRKKKYTTEERELVTVIDAKDYLEKPMHASLLAEIVLNGFGIGFGINDFFNGLANINPPKGAGDDEIRN